ncbi:glycosyltransferase [Consotaella salsifontis]|uniref:Glycosyltransferase, GT2 family n=1 Tax=Consotaella salsifontis TaxID=1365950 RepID=A0A1T4P1K2_9HYPH|nr:glycosyltransferase [Consotaella salsifontis]SJZ85490.1 Glycosyltransferase, GT2 family [Consotaella salsifontis]
MDTSLGAEVETKLRYYLDTPLPGVIEVGEGAVLLLRGWAYCPGVALRRLSFVFADQVVEAEEHSQARVDVFFNQESALDPSGDSFFSGFWAMIPVEMATARKTERLIMRAETAGGAIVEQELGEIELTSSCNIEKAAVTWPSQGDRVAICMATYNPPIDLFERQIESLRQQTHENWVCIVTDDQSPAEKFEEIKRVLGKDERFVLSRNPERLGFYGNFARSMSLVPDDAEYVALCDQDDKWDAIKLERLLQAFTDDTALVYSDARIVDEAGTVLSSTFWHNRRNNYKDLPTLLVANTITGAASMFRASLLAKILPLPERIGDAYHDHWIALVAYVNGGIGYVEQPLYEYVQHSGNVIGHYDHRSLGLLSHSYKVLRLMHRPRRALHSFRSSLSSGLANYRYVIRTAYFSRLLLLRNKAMPEGMRRRLFKFSQYHRRTRQALADRIESIVRRRPTLNVDGLLLHSSVSYRGYTFYHRLRRRRLAAIQRQPLLQQPALAPVETTAVKLASVATTGREPEAVELPGLQWIFHNLEPLKTKVSERYPRRINMLLGMIDFKYVFGGYLGMFNLALRLAREGHQVRIVLLEKTDFQPDNWRQEIKNYPGVTTLFDEVEVIYRYDRSEPVEMNPDDGFVVTNGWGAHVAHATMKDLTRERFLYMVQEYEPFFLPMNTISALFLQSYQFPQFQLFSTAILRDFFKQEKYGVFAHPEGAENSAIFSNAVLGFDPTREDLIRDERKLVFYARPEAHAARNMFELGIKALSDIARDPTLDLSNWSFYGMGSIGGASSLLLAPGKRLHMLPKTGLTEYQKALPRHDVGLSLMLTPHPSLVPLEMAGAGMWTVTNTFANKTSDRLREISTNIIGVEPTLDGIRAGLVDAISRVDDIDGRLAGSKVNWPTSWEEAFPPDDMQKVLKFLS